MCVIAALCTRYYRPDPPGLGLANAPTGRLGIGCFCFRDKKKKKKLKKKKKKEETDRQTDRQTDRGTKTVREAGSQTDRQTDRQADRQTDRQAYSTRELKATHEKTTAGLLKYLSVDTLATLPSKDKSMAVDESSMPQRA